MYNLFSYLWELETGRAYVMTKANDIYSGLGAEAQLQADAKQVAEVRMPRIHAKFLLSRS